MIGITTLNANSIKPNVNIAMLILNKMKIIVAAESQVTRIIYRLKNHLDGHNKISKRVNHHNTQTDYRN